MDLLYFTPLIAATIFWVWSSAWAFHDARRRGKPPLLVAILILICAWPLSLLVWIALRPDVISRRPFNLDDYRVQ